MAKTTNPNCSNEQAQQRLTLSAGAFGKNSDRANAKLTMCADNYDTQQLIQNYLYGNRSTRRQAKKMLRRKGVKLQ
jgi:hypothetical protein